ncbi:hypothetical protein, partial [Staphylococcus pasteuri]|uniref:hypothetical protein n=1 Tax=Staphylococcus pasteuri TaxID=45972 RepID=UPI001C9A1D01
KSRYHQTKLLTQLPPNLTLNHPKHLSQHPHPKHLHHPITLKNLKNPNTQLTLTIPHVSYYVTQDSPLHKEP